VVLSICEWLGVIGAARWISPFARHLWITLGLGSAIAGVQAALVRFRPDSLFTLHIVAVSQMLMAGLLVNMTGGHLETHFVYFRAAGLSFLLPRVAHSRHRCCRCRRRPSAACVSVAGIDVWHVCRFALAAAGTLRLGHI
jgi:hypothetical protein